MRLIDADVLKEIIEYQQTINPKLSVYDVIKLIDNAPTVLHDNYSMGYQDGVRKVLSERPTGKWIEGYHDSFETLDCSVCGYVRNERYSQLKYCPNCGAKMKGEE